MGEKLLEYYKYISEVKGLEGRIKLAQETHLPSTKAAIASDSNENIDLFRKVIKEITGTEAPKY